jgi:2-polyprenyl-6-methoxyphenol hydroxylase-like FAD-dependent oxidoreductase
VFGSEAQFEKYLGYATAAFSADEYPHRDEASYVSYCAPGRQVARSALRRNRTAFFFIFKERVKPRLRHLDLDAEKAMLREAFENQGWECPEILTALSPCEELYFDAVSQIRLPEWSRGRVALVGDAAFCPSLLAGQGSAFAMTGAYLLATELKKAAGNHHIAFRSYERMFKPFIKQKQRAAERFGGWFASKTDVYIFVRNQVTRLMSVPPIGRWLVGRMFADRFPLPVYGDGFPEAADVFGMPLDE